MRVKICGIQNEQDLATAIKADVDAVGFLVGQHHKSKSFILPSTARRLARMLPVYITPSITTHFTQAEEIKDLLDKAEIYTVQIHTTALDQLGKLRDILPPFAKIILTLYSHNLAKDSQILPEIYPLIDAIALDCYNCNIELVGQASDKKNYQWREGADFINNCPKPVILVGGLKADNVAQAVAEVNPFGVEGCSLLREVETDNYDPAACMAFINNAKKRAVCV
jgi:phosphoribosylanthranilate isomerase